MPTPHAIHAPLTHPNTRLHTPSHGHAQASFVAANTARLPKVPLIMRPLRHTPANQRISEPANQRTTMQHTCERNTQARAQVSTSAWREQVEGWQAAKQATTARRVHTLRHRSIPCHLMQEGALVAAAAPQSSPRGHRTACISGSSPAVACTCRPSSSCAPRARQRPPGGCSCACHGASPSSWGAMPPFALSARSFVRTHLYTLVCTRIAGTSWR